MLEEDPAKITVHLVQFEKYVPFCMPGAEGTYGNAFVVTWLRSGGRTIVAAPFGWGSVVVVHPSVYDGRSVCSRRGFSEIFVRRLLIKKWSRLFSCVLKVGVSRPRAQRLGGADNARSQSAMIHTWLPSLFLDDRRGVVLVMALLWICTVPRTHAHHLFPKTSFSWA